MLAQPGHTPISWGGSIDAIFLCSRLRARIFGQGYTDVNGLTEGVIKNSLRNLAGGRKTVSFNDALADVERNVCLDVSEPDASLRILMLQTSYIELCECRGLKFVEKAPKAAIKYLVVLLQPPALMSHFQDALRRQKKRPQRRLLRFC